MSHRPAPTPMRQSIQLLAEEKENSTPEPHGFSARKHRSELLDALHTAQRYEAQVQDLMHNLRRADANWEAAEEEFEAQALQHQQQQGVLQRRIQELEGCSEDAARQCEAAEAQGAEWRRRCGEVTDISAELSREADALRAQVAERDERIAALESRLSGAAQQRDADVAALEERLAAQRRQTDEAVAEAARRGEQLDAWRQARADLMRTLPTEVPPSRGATAGPELGARVPRQEFLSFERGAPAPSAAFAAAAAPAAPSPLAIFREVYGEHTAARDTDSQQLAPHAGQGVDEQEATAMQDALRHTQAQLTAALQALAALADVAKYFSRSLHLGYQHVSRPLIERRGLPSDGAPEVAQLAALWGAPALRDLDTVADVAARLAAVDPDRSVPTAGTNVEASYRLSHAEQAALRAESKRLRRAAEHQLFATLSCEALHAAPEAPARTSPAGGRSWEHGDAGASVRSGMLSSQRGAPLAGEEAPWIASPRRRRLQDSLIAVGDSARAGSGTSGHVGGLSPRREAPFNHAHPASPPASGKLRRLVQQRFAEQHQPPPPMRAPVASERGAEYAQRTGTPPFAARPRSATLSHDTHGPPRSRATAERYTAVVDEDSASVALSPPAVVPPVGAAGGERRDLHARLQAIQRDLAAEYVSASPQAQPAQAVPVVAEAPRMSLASRALLSHTPKPDRRRASRPAPARAPQSGSAAELGKGPGLLGRVVHARSQ